MTLISQPFDIDAIVDYVRSMRRDASGRAQRVGVELYAKLSHRVRVERRDDVIVPLTQHVFESGIAVRTMAAPNGHAGFAAASGTSPEVVSWVVRQAMSGQARVPAAGLDPAERAPEVQWDLDPAGDLPDDEALVTALRLRPALRWVEAGVTIEALAGTDDWCAVRRRQRIWAQVSGGWKRLVAQRGFGNWQELLDSEPEARNSLEPRSMGVPPLLFTPEAASPVVAALVAAFHRDDGPASTVVGGQGWTIGDDPTHPGGLSGGVIDDAGFPAGPRPLAENGRIVGQVLGPGTHLRSSFREPPLPAPSNLVMPPGGSSGAVEAVGVRACRVIRLGPEVWVLDLELFPGPGLPVKGRRAHARVSPRFLLERCVDRAGPQRVTAAGPIVPGLLFDGLALDEPG